MPIEVWFFLRGWGQHLCVGRCRVFLFWCGRRHRRRWFLAELWESYILVVLSSEDVVVLVGAAGLNGYFEHAVHLYHFFAFAVGTFVLLFHRLPESPAVPASRLRLWVHSGSELHHLHDRAASFAFAAFRHVFAALSFAGLADAVPADLHVFHRSVEDLLQSHLQLDQLCLALARPWGLPASAPTEKVEKSAESGPSGRSAILDSFFSVVIVELSFFRVWQDFIGVADLFELLWVSSFIGVFLERLLPEGFADLLGGGFFVDAEQLVVLGGVYFFFLLLRALLLLVHAAKIAEAPESTAEHVPIN